jgi:predicted nuclease of predicted toxin-antitoxin system
LILRILFDQNIAPVVCEFVRKRKPHWEVRHVNEVGMQGASDDAIFQWAQGDSSIVVTFGEDFGDARMCPAVSHAGVIRLRVWPTTIENTETALARLFDSVAHEDWQGSLVIVDEREDPSQTIGAAWIVRVTYAWTRGASCLPGVATSVSISETIPARAGRPFPVEPIRTLDAIHLATAKALGDSLGRVILIIARDLRIRESSTALRFPVFPFKAERGDGPVAWHMTPHATVIVHGGKIVAAGPVETVRIPVGAMPLLHRPVRAHAASKVRDGDQESLDSSQVM